jgi:hypothetical protein
MITSRDLDTIGPPPPRDPVRTRPPVLEASLGSGAVSVAAVLSLRGPCPRPVLDDLPGRVTALLAAGIQELVIDLSRVTDPDTRVLRAVGRIRRVIEERGGSVSLLGDGAGRAAARPTHHPHRSPALSVAAPPAEEARPGSGAGPGPTVAGTGDR